MKQTRNFMLNSLIQKPEISIQSGGNFVTTTWKSFHVSIQIRNTSSILSIWRWHELRDKWFLFNCLRFLCEAGCLFGCINFVLFVECVHLSWKLGQTVVVLLDTFCRISLSAYDFEMAAAFWLIAKEMPTAIECATTLKLPTANFFQQQQMGNKPQ